jgi:outer membrane protein assembly factor BamE
MSGTGRQLQSDKPHGRPSGNATNLLSTGFAMLVVAFSGCVYTPPIQQGNLLKISDIDQVETGMTRSQVRYLLGTPMVSDPFNPQRWDYIYRLETGRAGRRKLSSAHFIVYFEGDTVSRVDKLDLPDPPSPVERKWWRVDGPKEPELAESDAEQAEAPQPGENRPAE